MILITVEGVVPNLPALQVQNVLGLVPGILHFYLRWGSTNTGPSSRQLVHLWGLLVIYCVAHKSTGTGDSGSTGHWSEMLILFF